MTGSAPRARSARKLLGRTEPRLFTPPLRPLNRRTSLGYEVCDFMEITGEPFDPWQEWVVKHALELMPDGSFRFRIILVLVARQNGKSHLRRGVSLWRMYMQPGSRLLGTAQELTLAREQWTYTQDAVHASPDLASEWGGVRNVNGDQSFWLSNGSRYKISAANRKAGRGGSNDDVTIDELREQRSWAAWAALSKTTMARANSQIWLLSNAGDDQSVVLNQLLEVARSGSDPTIFLAEYSAPDGCELDDVSAWRQANPNLGRRVSEAAIRTALSTDPPEVFRTEVLCQRVANLDAAIDAAAWQACADPSGTMDAHRDRLAACLDAAPDGQHYTLAVAAMLADGRPRVEIVQDWVTAAAVRTELPALLAKIQPKALAWFPGGPAAELGSILRPLAGRYNRHPGKRGELEIPEDGAIAGSRVTEACQELAAIVRGRQIVHAGQELLDAHVRGASRLQSGDGWRFTRRGQGHVDAAYAVAGAIQALSGMPQPKRARIRLLVS